MATDPVCGMEVGEDAPYTLEIDETTYFFCSQECLDEFVGESEEYVTYRQETMGE